MSLINVALSQSLELNVSSFVPPTTASIMLNKKVTQSCHHKT